ncbi:MAG: molybdopterin-binding protein [Prolixibacteraceae bacterium]|jgi:molybdenum cofactor synthesis domain-containing protein|nr:molybdopterin-binding protein [Prolixibacteraceae bacterium]
MEKIKVLSVNISEKKGTIKIPAGEITLNHEGIQGDAHGGKWHRQVSLLGKESLEKSEPSLGRKLAYGEFAENITTEGFPLYRMKPLGLLISGQIVLEVTQIGKKCHGSNCAIFQETGNCVMPKEGIFCRVLKGGELKAGDILEYRPRTIQVHVVTLSDRASQGIYEDKSGPLLRKLAETFFSEAGRTVSVENTVMPDDAMQLKALLKSLIKKKVDIIFTTGGTGIGPRDITPDVVKKLIDKETPGIMELIRVKYGMQFPNALLSRSIAGVAGQTLLYALPGNPKAVKEYCDEIFKTVEHSFRMLYNIDEH